MAKKRLRIWQNLDTDDIKAHLIIIDDLYGNCAACGEIGLKYTEVTACPKCKTEFKYIASHILKKGTKTDHHLLARIQDVRPEWTVIDYDDYQHATAKSDIDKLFGG